MGETPLGDPKLLNEFDEFGPFGALAAPEFGPGVIGNGLPDPAFMPIREAARAGSSAMPGWNPFGHAPPFGGGSEDWEPEPGLPGATAGNDPGGGHTGIASKGEPVPVGGIDLRRVFGIGSGLGFGSPFGIASEMESRVRFGIAKE